MTDETHLEKVVTARKNIDRDVIRGKFLQGMNLRDKIDRKCVINFFRPGSLFPRKTSRKITRRSSVVGEDQWFFIAIVVAFSNTVRKSQSLQLLSEQNYQRGQSMKLLFAIRLN